MSKDTLRGVIGEGLMKTGIPGLATIGGKLLVSEASAGMKASLEQAQAELKPLLDHVKQQAAEKGMTPDEYWKWMEATAAEQRRIAEEQRDAKMAEARQAVEGTFSQAGWPEGLAQYNEYQKARFDLSAFLYESMDSEANGREEEKFAQVKAKTTSGLAEKGIDIAKLDGIMDKAIES